MWNVPYPRNPFFTGREELLSQLTTSLHKGQSIALSQPQAISGLGGIGKTQLALEYAYRSRHNYQVVLWALADTRENLTSSYLSFATLLNLPEQGEQESARVITAVKTWLQIHNDWLLILDNADELALARDFLPPSFAGHVLLTTRAQATGHFAHRLEVDVLLPEQGTLFLLHRAGLLAPDATLQLASEQDRALAHTLHKELGGLPLALDQAGAYIEETQCGLADYLQRYQTRRARLLKRRGDLVTDHPEAVATTWSLAFEKVERTNPAAADLLRLCAFLAPDAIPEELISRGAALLGSVLALVASDPVELDEVIAALGAYSLLHRDASEKTLSVHRLVQAVLVDEMDSETHRTWALRTVLVMNKAFPVVEFTLWQECERYLPHMQACMLLIGHGHLTIPEAADLLTNMGRYLGERGRYVEAELPLQQAMTICEQQSEAESLNTAFTAITLAWLYEYQGKYVEAEPLVKRALAIDEQHLGPEHSDTANSLLHMGYLYGVQGKYLEAEPLLKRALAIREQHLGPEHSDTAISLNNLGNLYDNQGKYEQAEPLYVRALSIREEHLGPEHPDTANSLNDLAGLYYNQGKYEQAEPLYVRALSIREEHLGPEHPDTATSLSDLAFLHKAQRKYEQAEPLYVRALAINKRILGETHPWTRAVRANYVALLRAMDREDEAGALEQREDPS